MRYLGCKILHSAKQFLLFILLLSFTTSPAYSDDFNESVKKFVTQDLNFDQLLPLFKELCDNNSKGKDDLQFFHDTKIHINPIIECFDTIALVPYITHLYTKKFAQEIDPYVNVNFIFKPGGEKWNDFSNYGFQIAVELSTSLQPYDPAVQKEVTAINKQLEAIHNLKDFLSYVGELMQNVRNLLRNTIGYVFRPSVEDALLLAKVDFMRHPVDGKYGFDAKPEHVHWDKHYDKIRKSEVAYYIPHQSLPPNASMSLQAHLHIKDSVVNHTKISFKAGGEKLPHTFMNDTLATLQLNHTNAEEIDAIVTLPDSSGKAIEYLIGRVQINQYKEQYKNLVIVPVNGNSAIYSIITIQNELNNIYQQGTTTWSVSIANNLQVNFDLDGDKKIQFGGSDMFSLYTDEMENVIEAYKKLTPIDKETYYIFYINKFSDDQIAGFMPMKGQYGFVQSEIYDLGRIIAHELGHGAFRLRHPFDEYPGIILGSTQNLMDYGGGTQLRKYQWDLIHNPERMLFAWTQDEEEGAMIIDRYKFTYNVTEQLGEAKRTNEYFVVDNQGTINLFSNALIQEINNKLKPVNDNGQPVYVIVDLFTYTEAKDIDQVKSEVDKQIQALKEANKDIVIIVAVGYMLVNENNVPLQEKPDLLIRSEFSKNLGNATSLKDWKPISQTDEAQVTSFIDDLIAALPYNSIFDSEDCLELTYAELGISSASELNPNDVKQWVSAFAGDNGVSIDYSYTGYPMVANSEIPIASLNQPKNSNADINIAVHFDDDGKKINICHHYKAGAIVIPSVTASGEPVEETTVDEIVGLSKVYAGKALNYAKSGGEKMQTLFNSAVKGVVAAKTWTKTICDKMEVPQQTWNQSSGKVEAYKRSPVNLEPLMAGVGDGAFEEIKSIPELITLALDVAFDKEVRASLWQSLTSLSWEDIKNMPIKMVKDKVDVYTNSHATIVKHEAGKDGVAIASMFFGFGSAKKAKELAETVGKNSTDYAKALQKAYDKIDVSKIDEFGVKLENLGGGVTGVKLKKIGNTNHTSIAKIDVDGNLSFTESEHVFEAVYEIEKKGGAKGYCVLDKTEDGKTVFREATKEVGELLAKRRKWLNDLKSKYGTFDSEKNFKPQGLDATNVPVGIKDEMLAEYPTGLADRIKFRDNLLKSGSDIPIKVDIKKGQELYKIAPKGVEVSDFTPFWMTLNELNSAKAFKNIEQKLGIPLQSHSVEYEIYKITAIKDTKTFESTVAKTIESGYTTSGGAKQTLVINRGSWSSAEKLPDTIIPEL